MKTKLSYFCGLLLLFSGWGFYYSGQQRDRHAESAVPFLAQALKDIASWRGEVLLHYLAPEAKQAITDEQLQHFLDRYRALGDFTRMNEPEFSRLSSVLSVFSSSNKINYSADVFFRNGSAVMTATLTERGGIYTFYNFNLGDVQLYQ